MAPGARAAASAAVARRGACRCGRRRPLEAPPLPLLSLPAHSFRPCLLPPCLLITPTDVRTNWAVAHDANVPLALRLAAAERVVQASSRDQAKARQLCRTASATLKLFLAMGILGMVLLMAAVYAASKLPLWMRLYFLEWRKLRAELGI
jgi:hypothetical protein